MVKDFVKRKRAELEREHARHVAGYQSGVAISTLIDAFEKENVPVLAPGAQEAYKDSLKTIRLYFKTEVGDPTVESIQAKHVAAFMTWRWTPV